MSRSRLFHGSPQEISDGMILPPNVVRGTDYSSHRAQNAYATDSPDDAWSYATVERPHNHTDPDPKYRSRVYEVAHAADESNEGYTTSPTGFKIIGTQWSKVGEQMTFPHFNWNAFSTNRGIRDANHWSTSDNPREPYVAPEPRTEVPGQLNLFSGRTAEEHAAYENIPRVRMAGVTIGEDTPGKHVLRKDPLTRARQGKNSTGLANSMNTVLRVNGMSGQFRGVA